MPGTPAGVRRRLPGPDHAAMHQALVRFPSFLCTDSSHFSGAGPGTGWDSPTLLQGPWLEEGLGAEAPPWARLP